MRYIFSLLLACACGALQAAPLPQAEPVPGGIAIVPLGPDRGPAPRATFNGDRVMVQKDGPKWVALVGIPLDAKPGEYALRVAKRSLDFSVRDKQYAVQRLTIENKRKVDPTPLDLERIRRESRIIKAALAAWHAEANVPLRFDLPVRGPVSSPFGLRRVFNGQARNPHSGLDIAAPAGAPIHA
ncbi:MAG: M23 family peptidase, partial [Burkholderiales bacterium]